MLGAVLVHQKDAEDRPWVLMRLLACFYKELPEKASSLLFKLEKTDEE